MAFYEAENKPELLAQYFGTALENIEELRDRCKPLFSPIDLLRCKLDELWPAGAHLEQMFGKKMFVGLSRVIGTGNNLLAHHDISAKDAPTEYRAHSLLSQTATNVYLKMPSEGGGICLWDTPISPEEFDQMRGESHGIDPASLGAPTVEVDPTVGDLLFFNSRLIHAVKTGADTERLSVSCFIGYRGDSSPLNFWS